MNEELMILEIIQMLYEIFKIKLCRYDYIIGFSGNIKPRDIIYITYLILSKYSLKLNPSHMIDFGQNITIEDYSYKLCEAIADNG